MVDGIYFWLLIFVQAQITKAGIGMSEKNEPLFSLLPSTALFFSMPKNPNTDMCNMIMIRQNTFFYNEFNILHLYWKLNVNNAATWIIFQVDWSNAF